MAFDETLRNPNVGPGQLSPEAQAWRTTNASPPNMGPQPNPAGMRAPPSVPGAAAGEAAAAQAARGGAFRAGQLAGQGLRGLKSTVGGGGAAPVLLASGVVNSLTDAADPNSTARYAKRFGVSEPTGDGSFGDIAKFAGLRTAGHVTDFGANILDVGTNVVNGMRGAFGAQPIQSFKSILDGEPAPATKPATAPIAPTAAAKPATAPVASAPAAAAAPPMAPPVAPTMSMRDDTMTNAQVAAANPAGKVMITEDANGRPILSGNNVNGAVSYVDAAGKPIAGKGMQGVGWGGGVTQLPTNSGSFAGLDPTLAAQLQQAKVSALARGESLGPGGVTMINGGGTPTPTGPMTRSQRADLTARRGQDMNFTLGQQGQSVQMRGQDVQSRGQDMNYDLGLRGQEVAREGHMLTAAGNRATNQREMYKMMLEQQHRDRDFNRNMTNDQIEHREKAMKNFNDWAGSLFTRPGKDNIPIKDEAQHAEFMRTTSATIGEMIKELQAKGDKSSLQRAEELRTKSFGALDDADKATLKRLYDRREAARKDFGYNFGSNADMHDDLRKYAITGRDNGLLQNRVGLAGGGSISDTTLRYGGDANHWLPNWGQPTTNLGPDINEQATLRRNR